jgi:hypothetical protein
MEVNQYPLELTLINQSFEQSIDEPRIFHSKNQEDIAILETQDQQMFSPIEMFHIEYDTMDKHRYFSHHSRAKFLIGNQTEKAIV